MTNLIYGEDMAASEDAMIAEIVHGMSQAQESSSHSFDSRIEDNIASNGWDLDDEVSNMSAKGSGMKRKLSKSGDTPKKKTKLTQLLEEGKHGVIDGRWVCGECGKSLSTAWGLELHLSSVHGEYIFPCDFCHLKFKRKDYALNHMKRIHECSKKCPKCSREFIGREAYADHMKAVHKIKVTYKSTVDKKRLDANAKVATKPVVKKDPASPPKLSKHGKKLGRPPKKPVDPEDPNAVIEKSPYVHKMWAFECKYCKKGFSSKDKLDLHLHTLHPQEMMPKVCSLCRRLFKDSNVLHEHIETHHSSHFNSYTVRKCSYCSGVFHSRASLEAHLRFYHMEEECLYCGSVFSGAFRMVEHISEVHPPFLTPYGHQCGCGVLYPARFHVLDHFRRRHVYHWGIISKSTDYHACPHCQLPFSSWALLDQHVLMEHKSYGFYYLEPDYVAIESNLLHDELVLMPCPVCNDLYHDQISLDKHVANDHEPFATRRPFNRKAVDFQLENIEYSMDRSVFADYEYTSDLEESRRHSSRVRRRSRKGPEKIKKRVVVPSPPPKSKVKVKKIIIRKKRTLKKLALIEERKRLKQLKEQEEQKKRVKKVKPDIDRSNIINSRTRHAKAPSRQLPQRRSSDSRSRRNSSGRRSIDETAKTPSKPSRLGRQTKTRTKVDESDEEPPTPRGRTRGRAPAPVIQQPTRRRYLIKDDPDLFHDSDEEVMPTPKQRGGPKPVKPASPEESESDEDSVEDDEDVPLVKPGKKPVSKPSLAKKTPQQHPVAKKKYLIVDDPDLFNDSDEEVMPTPKQRGKVEFSSEEDSEEEEEDPEEKVEDEEAESEEVEGEEVEGEEVEGEEVEDEEGEDEEEDEEDVEGEEEEEVDSEEDGEEAEKDEVAKPAAKAERTKSVAPDSDDELLLMKPIVSVIKINEDVVRRFSQSESDESEEEDLVEKAEQSPVNEVELPCNEIEAKAPEVSTNGVHVKNGNLDQENKPEPELNQSISNDDHEEVLEKTCIPMTNGYDKSNGSSNDNDKSNGSSNDNDKSNGSNNDKLVLQNGDIHVVDQPPEADLQTKSLPCTS